MAPRWGGLRPEPYDPDARDADGDGVVQEQTAWERPVGTNLVDELGRAIVRGSNSGTRPRGMRVVDSSGNDVDYTPTYARPGAAPGAERVGGTTALSDHGAGSLKERGMPTVLATAAPKAGTLKERGMRDVRAAAAPPPPPPPPEVLWQGVTKPEPDKLKPLATGYRTEHTRWYSLEGHRDQEVDNGNDFPDISKYPGYEAIWVTDTPEAAERYGDDVREVDLTGAIPLVADGDDGFLYIRPIKKPEPEKPDVPKPDVPEGEYRMSHQPSDDGPRAFDLTEDGGGDWSMPGDVYDNPNLYTGADATVRKETMEQLERVRGNPDGLVTVYRYAPEGREFEVGNWVSLSQTYARQHGESNPTPGGTVQSMQVPAKEVRFAGDDLAEFGWYPEAQDSKPEVKPDSKVNLPYVPAKNILEKDLSQREKRSRDDASMMARSDLSMLSPEERSLLRDYYEVETDEELLDAVIDKAIEGSRWQVRDVREGPLYVAVPERAISQVLADERLKSVFESGWSMGGDASGVRRSIEERQMGVPADLSDELRPIYGFQLHEEDGDSVTMSAASEHYGPFVLVLKSDVRERTTMTLGDSLDDNLYAVPVDGEITDLQASAAAGDLGLLRSMESVHNEWGDVLDRYDLQEGRDRDIWSEQRNYSEFQVHGGIRLEDVEEVVYPSWLKGRFDEFENVIAMLDKLGIKHGEDY